MTGWKGPALSAPVTLWLLLAFAAPLAVVILLSLQAGGDPFAPLIQPLSLAQFVEIAGDSFYFQVLNETILIGLATTAISAVLGYPLAYWLARMPVQWRALAFAVILIPLLTNVVVRSLGVMLLLSPEGLINSVLRLVGLPTANRMLFTHGAVVVGLAQVFMPFMVIALYDTMQSTSPRVHEAAESLGAGPAVRFLTVDLPLSLPGLRSGTVIVFLMSTTAYVSATLLGGKKVMTIGMLVMQEAVANLNAPLASALAIVVTLAGLVFAGLCTWGLNRAMPWARRQAGRVALPARLVRDAGRDARPHPVAPAAGGEHRPLLLPLGLVVIQSVNDVPLATAAGFRGFTWKWYEQVLFGGSYTASFLVSLQLAVVSVLVALALATPAAFALARYPFAGRGALLAFWLLPLSLPQIVIGVGMLKLLQIYVAIPPFSASSASMSSSSCLSSSRCSPPRCRRSTGRRRRRRTASAPARSGASCWSPCRRWCPACSRPASSAS